MRLTRAYERSVAMTISWLERSSGMIFEMIISVVRSPTLGGAGPALPPAAAPPPRLFFRPAATWKISASFCAISDAAVFCRLMIHTFSPAPG